VKVRSRAELHGATDEDEEAMRNSAITPSKFADYLAARLAMNMDDVTLKPASVPTMVVYVRAVTPMSQTSIGARPARQRRRTEAPAVATRKSTIPIGHIA
jgi:hypothetical protein